MDDISGTGLDWADLIDEAVQRSGGHEATAADVIKVRRGFRVLTERWINRQYNTWRIQTFHATALGYDAKVRLCEGLDDIVEVRVAPNGGAMTRISPAQYAQLTDKNALGTPSQFYLDRASRPSMYVYPIGSPGVATQLEVTYVARPAEFDRYDPEADVPGRWLEALVQGLALDLARKRPPYDEALIARLKSEAAEAESLALRADAGKHRFRYRTK